MIIRMYPIDGLRSIAGGSCYRRITILYIHHHLQISVGSGRCHHWRRSLPSLAAAAANHVPARCQPKKH
ncbi:MAG: hypothetical protein IJ892_04710, partial [Prevotella sp.]|nr:hypothetical protein [Prevotella sp.]